MTGSQFDTLLAVHGCRDEQVPVFDRILAAKYDGHPWTGVPAEWADHKPLGTITNRDMTGRELANLVRLKFVTQTPTPDSNRTPDEIVNGMNAHCYRLAPRGIALLFLAGYES